MATHHPLHDLLHSLTTWDIGMPVRPMEGILAFGAPATPAVVDVLDACADQPGSLTALWLLVVLGRLEDPRAVDAMLGWLARTDAPPAHLSAAAEGLARAGGSALPLLLERLEAEASEDERLWIYAALGWMRVEQAHERLVEALESDPALADVVASALSEWGRESDVPLLLTALEHCAPWQRPDVEDAVRLIHRPLEGYIPEPDRDWRLRYRIHPAWGTIPPGWPFVAAVRRKTGMKDRREETRARPLDEILADGPPADVQERCDDCGEPIERPTGLPTCPEFSVRSAVLQHALLGRLREQDPDIEDLFDILDLAEAGELELRQRQRPPGRRGERLETAIEEYEILRATCAWLIQRGVEDVRGGQSRLRTEATRLARRHGDPEGLLASLPPGARPREGVGRNDPCPCGSGRKHKKCCGAARRG